MKLQTISRRIYKTFLKPIPLSKMKTFTTRIFSPFYKFNHFKQCLRKFYSHYLLSVLSALSHVRQTLTEKLKNSKMQAALLTYRAGRVAFLNAWANPRFRVGVIVGLVALPAWKCHLFFDIDQRIEDFYFVNYVFYFKQIRWQLAFMFLSIAGFLVMPIKVGFRWISLPIFIFCVTEIWEISHYDYYLDFYQTMPDWQFYTLVIAAGVALHFSLDYLIYRKYHLKDGNAARIIGIVKTPGIPAEQKMNIMEKLVVESEDFNSRI